MASGRTPSPTPPHHHSPPHTPPVSPPAHSGGGVHAPNSPVTFRGVHQTTIPCMHASRRCSEGGSKLGMRRQRCVRQPGQKCRLAARPRVPPPGWAPPHGRPPEAHETPSVVRPHAAPKVFTPLLHHAGAPAWAARLVHGAPSGASTPLALLRFVVVLLPLSVPRFWRASAPSAVGAAPPSASPPCVAMGGHPSPSPSPSPPPLPSLLFALSCRSAAPSPPSTRT